MHVVCGAEVWGEGCEDASTSAAWVSALLGSPAHPEVSSPHLNRHDLRKVWMARKEPCVRILLEWKAEWNPARACRFLHSPTHSYFHSLTIY